jgi:alpha-mannosidase
MSNESVVLLPCHALSDFPYHHEGEAAADLLAAYTALWHPALLTAAGRMPGWRSAYGDSADLGTRLVVLPRVCGQDLPGSWPDEARSRGSLLVEAGDRPCRDALVEQAVNLIGCGMKPLPAGALADFYCLGLCHLLVELLTIQMRYSSLIDEELFSKHLLAAAEAALELDEETAREKLAVCFDALHQSRCHFYPVDCYLLDLTLLAHTTLGPSLRHELARGVPTSLLASGAVVAAMGRSEPTSVAAVREAVDNQWGCLVGGEYEEAELPLLPPEQVLRNFQRGLREYEAVVGARPKIFGRRRAGLSPLLPQLLEKLNFAAALHFTLDDGRFPTGRQSLTRWEGRGAVAIDALTRPPHDARLPESVLAFPQHMGTAMDMDHVAIVAFAHWPGMTSTFYDDLRRSAAYGAPVGRYVTLEKLFQEAEVSGQLNKFAADEYRTPYLVQDVAAGAADPISRVQKQHAAQAAADVRAALEFMTAVVRGSMPQNASAGLTSSAYAPEVLAVKELEIVGTDFSSALPRQATAPAPGYLVVNPLSFARRVAVSLDNLPTPPIESTASGDRQALVPPATLFARELSGHREAIVDLPPMGYVWVSGERNAAWQPPDGKPLAEEHTLRNEFCEVEISAKTGGVQSIMTPNHRGNRLSQQLAFRQPGPRPEPGAAWQHPDETASYSSMVADEVKVERSGPATGQIASRGRLLDANGATLANFSQRTTISRSVPVLWLDVEIEPLVELAADPWQHYIAARFAWPDEFAELARGVGLVAEPTEAGRIEAPEYLDIRSGQVRTAILPGGLPYHRRIGNRLDTLLIVDGETKRQFRLGIGLDLTHPHAAALEGLAPPVVLFETAVPLKNPTAWLFHIDVRNVVATHWEAVSGEHGRVRGVRVRLLEAAGRPGTCGFHSHRPLAAARRLDFLGSSLGELQVDGEKVIIDMAPGEWVLLEVEWK